MNQRARRRAPSGCTSRSARSPSSPVRTTSRTAAPRRSSRQVDGWIVGIRPNLEYANGKTPGVDVIHLHHAVWLNLSAPDTTDPGLPRALLRGRRREDEPEVPAGLRLRVQDDRPLAPQLHAPQPHAEAATRCGSPTTSTSSPRPSPAAKDIKPARPIWMDVQNGETYPVFDVPRGGGHNGEYTYPDDAKDPYNGGPAKNVWTVDQDGTLLATAGHVHPGGLRDDLWLQRDGAVVPDRPARSPAPPTPCTSSRRCRTTTSPPDRSRGTSRCRRRPTTGACRCTRATSSSITATYDSKLASWYEGMGIMVVWMADGDAGKDPFTTDGERARHPHARPPGRERQPRRPDARPEALRRPDEAAVADGARTAT